MLSCQLCDYVNSQLRNKVIPAYTPSIFTGKNCCRRDCSQSLALALPAPPSNTRKHWKESEKPIAKEDNQTQNTKACTSAAQRDNALVNIGGRQEDNPRTQVSPAQPWTVAVATHFVPKRTPAVAVNCSKLFAHQDPDKAWTGAETRERRAIRRQLKNKKRTPTGQSVTGGQQEDNQRTTPLHKVRRRGHTVWFFTLFMPELGARRKREHEILNETLHLRKPEPECLPDFPTHPIPTPKHLARPKTAETSFTRTEPSQHWYSTRRGRCPEPL